MSTTRNTLSAKGQKDWPDPKALPIELPPVKPFDAMLLPESLRPWVADISDRMQCPCDYPSAAAVVALAGVVGRKVGIYPKRRDNWVVVPNLYGLLIGRPSLFKTPAMQQATLPLRRLEVEARKRYEQALVDHEADELVAKATKKKLQADITKALKDGGDAEAIARQIVSGTTSTPVRRRYITSDPTVEKLGELLRDNPNGMTIIRDELVGFLRMLDKDGREGDRAFYLEAWNGTGPFTYDRIGRGTIEIPAAVLSILGCATPGGIATYAQAAVRGGSGDDGLLQRFQVTVWPDVPGTWRNVDRLPDKVAKSAAWDIFQSLDELDASSIGGHLDDDANIYCLPFAASAQAAFDRWRTHLELRLRGGSEHPALESHLAKYRSLVPTLALLSHLADVGGGPIVIDHLDRAVAWAEYLESHARRLYGSATDVSASAAKQLAKHILEGDLTGEFTLRDVYRHCWTGLDTKEEAAEAAELLVDLDWLAEALRADKRASESHVFHQPQGVTHGQAA